ncbi:MAG TPA: carboxymuconolactone decarboxylase family protein [Pirellulales bacterium]|jgi:AhpD family alkylhydroperoxidase|nr:carboxymuconolactone decarboxylase family protein [Pirellulales bacterium]
MSPNIDYYQLNKPAFDALGSVGKQIASIEPKLRALVELRVSQINGCGYCVDIHSVKARSHGETQQRLDCLAAWWECDFFSPAESAALRWAEAVTSISHSHAPSELLEALKPHFSELQIVDLTLIIATMNAWNRIAIAHHKHPAQRAN